MDGKPSQMESEDILSLVALHSKKMGLMSLTHRSTDMLVGNLSQLTLNMSDCARRILQLNKNGSDKSNNSLARHVPFARTSTFIEKNMKILGIDN